MESAGEDGAGDGRVSQRPGGTVAPQVPLALLCSALEEPFPRDTRPDGSQENMHPSDSRLTDLTPSWGKGAVLETGVRRPYLYADR